MQSGLHKWWNPAIQDWRIWTQFGEYGEHGKEGKHQLYELKHFMIQNSLFVDQMTENTFFSIYSDG